MPWGSKTGLVKGMTEGRASGNLDGVKITPLSLTSNESMLFLPILTEGDNLVL